MNQIIKVLSLLLLLHNCNGITRKNNVKQIINSNAIFTTFTNSMNSEIINENLIITELSQFKFHQPDSILYLLLCIASFYTRYTYNHRIENKWEKLEMFSETQKNTRRLLFVFMIVFTKNLENAI